MSGLPGYDAWLERPYDKQGQEEARFEEWYGVNEERLREEYEEKLVNEGVLDDELADYDEDKFQEWVSKQYDKEVRA